MTDTPTYLWNWAGTRKHIDTGQPDAHGRPTTICGQLHRRRETSLVRHRAEKLDAAPLCQKCAKKAGVGLPPTAEQRLAEVVRLADAFLTSKWDQRIQLLRDRAVEK